MPAPDDPTPALLDAATAAIEAVVRPGRTAAGAGRPKFPQPMTIEYLLRRHLATGDAAAAGDRPALARRDGRRRAPRPARRRLPSLLDRRALARPALRADALRQRPARARLRARLGADRGRALSRGRDRDARLHAPRADDRRRRVRGQPGRRHRRHRGPDVHLARAPRSATSWATTAGARSRRPTASPTRATGRASRSCRGSRPTRSSRSGSGSPAAEVAARLAEARAAPARAAREAAAAGPRRQGAGGLERARDRGVRRRGAWRFAATDPARRRTYRDAADRAATTIVDGLLGAGRRPSAGRGRTAGRSGSGVLEDYAHLADGLLALYEATFDERWFTTARALMDRVLARFADPAGGFFDTADDHERLVDPAQGRPGQRGPVGQRDGGSRPAPARGVDRRGRATATRRSGRCARWSPFVGALPDRVRPVARRDGPRPGARSSRSRSSARRTTRPRRRSSRRRGAVTGPNQVVAVAADPAASAVPLLADRVALDGRPTAYVCRGFVCRLPVTEAAALAAQLLEAP